MSDNSVTAFLVKCVNDIQTLYSRMVLAKGAAVGNINENRRLRVSLMEPTIEFMMKCIFKDASEVCYGVL